MHNYASDITEEDRSVTVWVGKVDAPKVYLYVLFSFNFSKALRSAKALKSAKTVGGNKLLVRSDLD